MESTTPQIDSLVAVTDTIPQPKRVGIKMAKSGGVYEIPCLVNGVRMNFIFDTGASNVCISLTEALFLYKNGYITDEDLGGKTKSVVADGSIKTNTKLKIKTIEIGGIILKDVDALVSSSIEAPLLLGQTALQKLGKFEIDGDSLFITGIVEHPQENKKTQPELIYSIPPSTPKITMWDKISAFLGSESKVEEFCIKGLNAYQNDMPELAIKYCDEAIKIRKKSWKPYALKGNIKLQLVKYSKNEEWVALEDFRKAVELNKNRQTFYLNEVDSLTHQYILGQKCWCELQNNQLDLALQDAQQGLELYPQDLKLTNTIAAAYALQDKYELAEKWADKLKDIDLATAYFRLGFLYHRQGRLVEAAKQYELCLATDPDRHMAENNLSNVYEDMGYQSGAIELKKTAARHGVVFSQEWLKRNGYSW